MVRPRKSGQASRSGDSSTFSASACNGAKCGSFSSTAAVRALCSFTHASGLSPLISSSHAYLSAGLSAPVCVPARTTGPAANISANADSAAHTSSCPCFLKRQPPPESLYVCNLRRQSLRVGPQLGRDSHSLRELADSEALFFDCFSLLASGTRKLRPLAHADKPGGRLLICTVGPT